MKTGTFLARAGETLVGAAALAGSILFVVQHGTDRTPTGARGNPEIPAVTVEKLHASTVPTIIEGIGTGVSKESVDITANATEKVVAVSFADGDSVKKGDLLVQLADEQYQAELRQTRINLEEQQREFNRITPLYAKKVVSQKEYDSAQTAVNRAQTAIDAVEYQIGNRRICAPFDGKLGMRKVSVGDLVTPGTQITTIDDISEIKVDFNVSEKYFPKLKVGLEVGITNVAFPGEIFKGTIRAVSARIDAETRSAEARATVSNRTGKLAPGMLFIVQLNLGNYQSLMIPEKAVMSLGEMQYVYLYDRKGVARRKPVQLGFRREGRAEVLSGLAPGDLLITDGVIKLVDGAAVKPAGREK